MSMEDNTDAKADREEEERKDNRICHWGNEGLWTSALSASSDLTNGEGLFRIRGHR